MRAIERLRRDHQILRSKLDVLEAAIQMGPETWFVLREVCFTLSRQLRDHIKREEELVASCRRAMIPPPAARPKGPGSLREPAAIGGAASGGMNPKVLAEVVVEHHDEPAHLRTINRLFLSERGHTLERIRPALQEVIDGLRRHMAEEEADLFPILERVLAEHEVAEPVEAPRARIEETMTVNRVIQAFPGTQPVFERLFINIPMEGCACLDEVAWRHGMESRELLAKLEAVMAHGDGQGEEWHEAAHHSQASCACR